MSMAPATTHAEAELAAFGAQDRILEINNIEVIYDHVILVLKGVSLAVPRGGIVALLGANGAGKTTTLKAISNLLHSHRAELTTAPCFCAGREVGARPPTHLGRWGWAGGGGGRRRSGPLPLEEPLLPGASPRRDGKAAVRRDLDLVYTYFPRLKERRDAMAGYT